MYNPFKNLNFKDFKGKPWVLTVKILSIDIGRGTQDILLFNSETEIENSLKMVLPSPTQVYSSKIKEATEQGLNVYLYGDIIGGGPIVSSIKKHIEAGLKVYMDENCAFTVRNNIEEVTSMGIHVLKGDHGLPSGLRIELKEIFVEEIKDFLSKFKVDLNQVNLFAVAVQDHGKPPKGMSNRAFRFKVVKRKLKENPRLEFLAYWKKEVPSYFLRMKSAVRTLGKQVKTNRIMVMDTSHAALLGCLEDKDSKGQENLVAVNIGNQHTVAASISKGEVKGIFEAHTDQLTPNKLENYVRKLVKGLLTNREIYDSGGHGAFSMEPLPGEPKIMVTGPKRKLVEETGLNFKFASPAGDTMMTGPVGLVKAAKHKMGLD